MEEKYIYIIASVVVILALRLLYSLMKKAKAHKISNEEKEQEQKLREESLAKKKPIATAAKNETPVKNNLKKAISQEDIDKARTENTPKKSKSRVKRTVPAHGKITRQSFNDFAGAKILVAEDNIINQKVIKGLLGDTGIEITIANDGQEALDILEKNSKFSIVLMDAHMPNIDGFEATRRIRANPNYEHIAVIALSGDTATDDLKKMADAGMERQLEKPLKIDALYDILYAYTNCENEEHDSSKEIKELNFEKGLEVCGGDTEFYNEILDEFVQTYQNPDDLHNLLKENKLKEADKLLLDILGVTSNIGADTLHNIASVVKEALNDTQEKSYLTLMQEYKMHLTQVIKDIKEYK